jgi:hypothetical protein
MSRSARVLQHFSGETQRFRICLARLLQTAFETKVIFLETRLYQSHFVTLEAKHLVTSKNSSYSKKKLSIMQSTQQQDSTIINTARHLLIRGIRFFATLCGRKVEKKKLTYEWEERLAYVEAEHEAENGEANQDEHDMQFERSCGVSRYKD